MSVTSLASEPRAIRKNKLSVVGGKVVSAKAEQRTSSSNNPEQHCTIPSKAGVYVLITDNFEQVVYVSEERGAWYYKTFDSQRGYTLTDNQVLIGPVTNLIDLSGFRLEKDKFNPDSVPKAVKAEMEKAEQDAEEAWAMVVKLEKQVKILEESYNNHPASAELSSAKKELEKLRDKLAISETNANVAREELETQLSENVQMKSAFKKLEKELEALKASNLNENVESVGTDVNIKEPKVISDQDVIVSIRQGQQESLVRLQMLLISAKAKLEQWPDLKGKLEVVLNEISSGNPSGLVKLRMLLTTLQSKLRETPDLKHKIQKIVKGLEVAA